jgi:hypothetical protein
MINSSTSGSQLLIESLGLLRRSFSARACPIENSYSETGFVNWRVIAESLVDQDREL